MSEPAKAEKIAPPKAAATKPKSTAPLPKQPGQSPATPALAKLRRALGDLLSGYSNKRTHMIQIYATNLRSALDAALELRNVATEAERKELDSIEARAGVLLLHAANPDSNKTKEEISIDDIGIDWDFVSDTLDQVGPSVGKLVVPSQTQRDCVEAITRSTLYVGMAFGEQWEKIKPHWLEFLQTTATLVAMEVAVLILSTVPTPPSQLIAIVLQGLIIAFVAYAAVNLGQEAGTYAAAFWTTVRDAKGDLKKIDLAAQHFARLVVLIIRTLAEAAVGGVLVKLSLKGLKKVIGPNPVTVWEIPVRREQLTIRTAKTDGLWELKIEAPLPDGSKMGLVEGYAYLDRQGLPDSGPSFTIDKRVDGTKSKVQVYQGDNVVSLTDVALEETIGAFKKDFGHPPDSLPGSLGWENAANFQRAYVDAIDRGLPHDAAANAAIRDISFGRSRAAHGYGDFKVSADRFMDVDLDKGSAASKRYGTRRVPTSIKVNAKRSK